MKLKVFISSPYTNGDVALNVKAQIKAANQLMNAGHTPFVPLLSHFQHMIYPRPYADWLQNDMDWLDVCDIVLRLPGESEGADKEVEYAKFIGKPIVYSIDEIKNHLQ